MSLETPDLLQCWRFETGNVWILLKQQKLACSNDRVSEPTVWLSDGFMVLVVQSVQWITNPHVWLLQVRLIVIIDAYVVCGVRL